MLIIIKYAFGAFKGVDYEGNEKKAVLGLGYGVCAFALHCVVVYAFLILPVRRHGHTGSDHVSSYSVKASCPDLVCTVAQTQHGRFVHSLGAYFYPCCNACFHMQTAGRQRFPAA